MEIKMEAKMETEMDWERFIRQFLQTETVTGMIFDVDGTILDSMPVWAHCGEQYLSMLGIQADASLGKKLFSMTMQRGAAYIRQTFGLRQTVDEIQAGLNQIVAGAYRDTVLPKPQVPGVLDALQEANIPMVVVTSTDRPHILAAFRRLGLMGYFKEIITCSEFGSGKNSPEIFYAAATCMDSQPEHTWVVEDACYAIKTAKEAGFPVIGVPDATSRDDEPQIRRLANYFISPGGRPGQ